MLSSHNNKRYSDDQLKVFMQLSPEAVKTTGMTYVLEVLFHLEDSLSSTEREFAKESLGKNFSA